MDKNFIIDHMNSEHEDCLIKLFNKYGSYQVSSAKMVDCDDEGVSIEAVVDGSTKKVRAPFGYKAENLKNAIVELCKGASNDLKEDKLKAEIEEFKNSFGSVILSSVTKDGFGVASYSAIAKVDGKVYIYISAVSDHHASISANPDKISALFLQDEKEAKTIIARKRLVYKTKAVLVERGSAEFQRAIDAFVSQHSGNSGISQIIEMRDFSMFRLDFQEGRYVKGFGGAFDIAKDGTITPPHLKNPHDFK